MKQKLFCMAGSALLAAAVLSGCVTVRQAPPTDEGVCVSPVQTGEAQPAASGLPAAEGLEHSEEETGMKLNVQIGESTFTATLEQNAAAEALAELVRDGAVTIRMSDYGGFEKVGSLGVSLPAGNRQTTTQSGDIVLYQGSQIVLFYGSNTWSYTRLGRIDELAGWADALGGGAVTVTFSPVE